MSERKIARTVAEAQAGDLIWFCEPQRNLYDADRKYLGRGVWTAGTVKEVGRLSIVVGNQKYDRRTGEMRGNRSGLSGMPFVAGYEERAERWWKDQTYKLAKAVEHCRSVETLKTIAFALGVDPAPDFTAAPVETNGTGGGR